MLSIENKRNINCGTIWGTTDAFIELSKIIYKNLLKYFTIDQTVLNYLIYYENILNDITIIFSDEYGEVLTLGLTGRNKIILDSEQNILNFNNQIASIVHQYDRYPDIKRMIKEKGVKLNQILVEDINLSVNLNENNILQYGKNKFVMIK